MSSTRQTILQALREIRLIDPHSHINPHQPASTTLADLLGYHYYTELVHSAGTPKAEIESSSLEPRELVRRLVKGLPNLTNTAQYAWLIDICQRFYGFEGETLDESNWESLYDSAEETMKLADWADVVLEKSNVEAVFLTNDFDDELTGFDTRTYIPCLRTDELVFHLSKPEVRERLAVSSGIDIDGSLLSIRHALEQRFEHFLSRGARACAISLPPDFSPAPVSDGRASTALEAILRSGPAADASHRAAIANRVFWTIVELCDHFKLPMDLMIGVNRGVYGEGVHQGRDLYDSRVSLIQYRKLLNAFPDVKFPISVLASVTNQELVSYAWIFPNVITNGHWWYSNTPSFIRRDAAARLEAVPRNNQIGYYSDAYKLEFIAPKFDMYRRILAGILMDDFVIERGWSEERAIELGRQVMRGNVDTIFPDRSAATENTEQATWPASSSAASSHTASSPVGIAAASAAAAGLVSTLTDIDLLQNTGTADHDQRIEEVQFADEYQLADEVQLVDELQLADELTADDESSLDDAALLADDVEQSGDMKFGDLESSDVKSGGVATLVDDDLSVSTLVDWSAGSGEQSQSAEADSIPESLPELNFDSQSSDASLIDFSDEAGETAQPSDPHATLDSWPEIELDSEHSESAAAAETESSEIHYFRADDIDPAAPDVSASDDGDDEDQSTSEQNESIGLYADPTTGELTWPISDESDLSEQPVEPKYLLPDEPEAYISKAAADDSPDEPEILDFEELEFTDIEDDSELLVSSQDSSDDLSLFDPDETLEFESDEEPKD